ncbi:MAG TPA: ATP-dependent DNA helicase RecG [Bacteroidales bacterium]|nr:ATP-dependent DNA helicase RecG [Bacteroidales bacterium]
MYQPILNTSIEYLKGVGPARAELLRKELNVHTYEDLLYYFPFRHVDRSEVISISNINSDAAYIQVKGVIRNLQEIGSKRNSRLTAILQDDSGAIELVWFKGIRWVKEKIIPGKEYLVFGKPNLFNNKFNIPHPEIDLVEEAKILAGEPLQPFYSSSEKLKSKGLHSKGIAKIMSNLVEKARGSIPEILPAFVLKENKLMEREDALLNMHFPSDALKLSHARFRLKFEELFLNQLPLLMNRQNRKLKAEGHLFAKIGDHFNNFYHQCLPFKLTNAQKRVIREIRQDTGTGKQMNRLLQGDVGSGKTVVALLTMLMALDNGCQACMMAPTEILANQHFETLQRMLQGMDLKIELLTGSTKTAKRNRIHEALLSGDLKILVGTHALIEDVVQFKNLGMVIIDEQHRFGVAQRAKLWQKNTIPPHVLVMTATPIPRTLAMTLYGDLDYSAIDEMPPGRKPVKTIHFYDSQRLRVFGFMKQQIKEGRQIYVVYPLIQESETLDLKDLMDGYESIVREFPLPEYAVSIVHGQMKAAEKDYEMQRFVKGETQIMVATTVIEVGVDVPNASVMVIENAERFGLSQLHQLRGRVGRGADQSYCILMSSYKLTNEAKKRLATMVQTNDGFEIASVDLQLRGPGELLGTRQSGTLEFKIAELAKDGKILQLARLAAEKIAENNPELNNPDYLTLKRHLKQITAKQANWGKIS